MYKYLSDISYEDFCKDLYYSYDLTNEYLDKKYSIDYSDFGIELEENIILNKKAKKTINQIGKDILPFEKLDWFIEYVSNIDLEKYKDKISECVDNVFM